MAGLIAEWSNLLRFNSKFCGMEKKYKTLRDFYPFYLTEHQNFTSRVLHFTGTSLFLAVMIYGLVSGYYWMLLLAPVAGYGFAWVGHFFFERNKPATFTYPLFSLVSDFIMAWHILTGQLPSRMKQAREKIAAEKN